jgi:hypothetical protein
VCLLGAPPTGGTHFESNVGSWFAVCSLRLHARRAWHLADVNVRCQQWWSCAWGWRVLRPAGRRGLFPGWALMQHVKIGIGGRSTRNFALLSKPISKNLVANNWPAVLESFIVYVNCESQSEATPRPFGKSSSLPGNSHGYLCVTPRDLRAIFWALPRFSSCDRPSASIQRIGPAGGVARGAWVAAPSRAGPPIPPRLGRGPEWEGFSVQDAEAACPTNPRRRRVAVPVSSAKGPCTPSWTGPGERLSLQ